MKNRFGIIFCIIALTLALAQPLWFALPSFAEEPEPAPADTATLSVAIQDAEDYKKTVRPSTDGTDIATDKLWASQSAFNALNASIGAAKEILSAETIGQNEIDAQAAAMKNALAAFKDACEYGTKTDSEEPPKEVVKEMFIKTDASGSDGKTHFVGEDFDSKYKTLSITEKGKTLQLNGWFTTNMSDGVMYETANSSSPIGEVALQWVSSGNGIATVSPSGLITPIADGEVTITARVSEESKYEEGKEAPSKSVKLLVSGQSAAYVKSVTIIGENGNNLSKKTGVSTVIQGKNKFFQFYALVVWHDPRTGADRTEDTRTDKVSSTIKWSVGGSGVVATINETTGRLKASEYSGNCFVQCSVTGGNGGKTVKDTANVQVDTGEYAYAPAADLTLKVVYQQFPDKVAQTHTYSLSELSAQLPAVTNSYTVFGGSRYGVIRASGYLFKDVVALEGVDIHDVYQFRFTTADGYDNPITTKMLYESGSRYYFPNWDIGSRAGAKVVPPVLAFRSNMLWGESMADNSVTLDEGTRFRLVFGPLWGGEANSSYQIYYIRAITIVLKGAPPADIAGNGNDDGGGDKAGAGAGGIGNGDGGVGGGNDGAGSGGNSPVGNLGGGGAETTGGLKTGSGAIPNATGDAYKVFEMISNSKSRVAPLNMDLPFLSVAAPLAGGCVAIGGISFFIGYRRRIG
jgi:hypothetical protein